MNFESMRHTLQTAVIWVVVVAIAVGLWEIRTIILLSFGAILLAILLRVLASAIFDLTRIPEGVCLAAATVLLVAIFAMVIWLFESHLSSQFNDLLEKAKAGAQNLNTTMQNSNIERLGGKITDEGTSFITSIFEHGVSLIIGFVEAVVVISITAIYLAAQPRLYRHGVAMLFLPPNDSRVITLIDTVGRALKLWMLGQFLMMLLVAVLSFIAVVAIGLPNPVALALVAGLTEAIPYFGPFVGAIPAVLVALTIGMPAAVWTLAAYICVHLLEGYIAAPLIQRHFVTIPPALVLVGIVAATLLFGPGGTALGAPITVALYIAIKMLYSSNPLEEDVGERRVA